jgi:glutamine synthetase
VVRNVAFQHGPACDVHAEADLRQNGSGMHTHQSLFRDGRERVLRRGAADGMSKVMRYYAAGLLRHARRCAR